MPRLLTATIAVFLSTAGVAVADPPTIPEHREPTFPAQTAPPTTEELPALPVPTSAPATWDKLKARADKDGTVRVIVGLNVRVKPEGKLTLGQRLVQRQAVDARRLGMLRILKGRRFGNVKNLSPVPFVAMDVSRDALAALQRSGDVASVAEDTLLELDGVTSNANLNDWWDIYQTRTDTAWNNGYDGRGQTIGVLDTGTQSNHPWLAGKVVREACYAYITAGSASGSCPNGSSSQTGAGAAQPCTYHEMCAHGTHVAATAAGTYGVARRANLIAVQVFHRDPATGEPRVWSSDLLWGLKYVYDQRGSFSIASVNLSLGGGQWTGYCDGYDSQGVWQGTASSASTYFWIAYLRAAGIATVISSGNNSYTNAIGAPACNSNAISVGNTTLDPFGYDAVFYGNDSTGKPIGSNTSSALSVLAPGTDICSAVPANRTECGWTGTSMAAPHVAGAIASLKQLRPWTTVSASLTALQNSGTPVSAWGVTRRRLDVWDALTYLYNH
jgi:subtilisin family serine protease